MTSRDELRDGTVDRAWRETMRESPPAAIDDAIRAAARRAVGAKPRAEPVAGARAPWRWWMPLAAAATIGAIAIGVIQTAPQDAVEPTVLSDAASARKDIPAPAAPPQPASAPIDQAKVAAAPPVQEASRPRQRAAVEADARGSQAPAGIAPSREDAAPKLAAKPNATPAESKEIAADKPDAARKQEAETGVAALGKRSGDDAARAGRDELGAASGFVASPPPASAPAAATMPASPPVVAAAAPAPAGASAAGGTGASGAVGRAQSSSNLSDADARAKVRTMPERPLAAQQAAPAASATAEPQSMAVTPPDVFVAEIRRRLAIGDRDGAVRELQRFRRTHVDADARLPEKLRAFAASVPR